MPQPKKKTSKSKQGHTRSHWKTKGPTLSECPQCHQPTLPHHACGNCGHYNGRQVTQPSA